MICSIVFLAFLCVQGYLVAGCGDEETQELFAAFKETHNKTYDSPEDEEEACNNFEKNVHHVSVHNIMDDDDYEKGIHEYSDQSPAEAIEALCGAVVPDNLDDAPMKDFSTSERAAPDYVNWVEKGMVNAVKNQGGCGSCWAFAAAQAIEFLIKKTWNDQTRIMAEQQIVDCDTKSSGCGGGWPDWAFEYVANNNGLLEEHNYNYKAEQGTCNPPPRNGRFCTSGFKTVAPRDDEEAVKNAVADVGVLAVCIYVSDNFFHYKSGVFFDDSYDANKHGVNHCVGLVGYGRENNQDYWLLRNSWGSGWGDNGYMKLARNRGNHIKIATYATYPEGMGWKIYR